MKTRNWLIILLFLFPLPLHAAWSQPSGIAIGTPNYGNNINNIYDGNPDTWTEMDEVGNYSAFPYAYFGVKFNYPQALSSVRFRNSLVEWNHIQEYSIAVLPFNKDGNVETNWITVVGTTSSAYQYGWIETTFSETIVSQIRVRYSKIIGNYAAPVGEIEFIATNPPCDSTHPAEYCQSQTACTQAGYAWDTVPDYLKAWNNIFYTAPRDICVKTEDLASLCASRPHLCQSEATCESNGIGREWCAKTNRCHPHPTFFINTQTDCAKIGEQWDTYRCQCQFDKLPPVAAFTISQNSETLTVNLNAFDSKDTDGFITHYQWTSSDGQQATGRTSSFTFPSGGSYTITLIVKDNDGLTGTETRQIELKTYTLTLNKSGSGSGTVDGGGTFPAGVSITPTAKPDQNSEFTGWSPSNCSTIKLTADTICTANFTPKTYRLTLNQSGNGSGTVSGEGNYTKDTPVKLMAIPSAESLFVGWSPSPCAENFTMPGNALTCNAKFDIIPVCGVFHLDRCTTQEQCEGIGNYWYLKVCNFLPITAISEESKCVEAGGDWYQDSCYDQPVICNAFHLDRCTTQAQCEQVGKYWYLQICNFSPVTSISEESKCVEAGGYWDKNNCRSTPVSCDTFHLDKCLTKEQCESAGKYWYSEKCNTMPLPKYSLTLEKAGSGNGTVSGGGSYTEGSDIQLTATAFDGSIFSGWNPVPCADTFKMPGKAVTCTATFEAICHFTHPEQCLTQEQCEDVGKYWYSEKCNTMPLPKYSLTLEKAGSGNGTVNGGGSYTEGSDIKLTATAFEGSVFSGWNPVPCADTFKMPGKAVTCTATFEAICHFSHLEQCSTQEQCIEIGKYWYSNICNSLPMTSLSEQSKCVSAGGDWYHDRCYDELVVCDTLHLDRCTTQAQCEQLGKYWYLKVCNFLPITSISEESKCVEAAGYWDKNNCRSTPVTCDVFHLEQCNKEQCESIGKYWYSEECNAIDLPKYSLILGKTGNGNGTVSGDGSYTEGSDIKLTATAFEGSVFSGWNPAPCAETFKMPENELACTATFEITCHDSHLEKCEDKKQCEGIGKHWYLEKCNATSLPPLLSPTSIDKGGNFAPSGSAFRGGSSVAEESFTPSRVVAPQQPLNIAATIEVAPTDIGKTADILFVIGTEPPATSSDKSYDGGVDTTYTTINSNNQANPVDLYAAADVWMAQLTEPFKTNVTLEATLPITLWTEQTLESVGMYYFFVGYRLEDGTIIYNARPIMVEVQ